MKPEAEGLSGKENALWMKQHLEALIGIIPELIECEVGINISDGDFDACLISKFKSMEDLKKYKTHPEHVKISSYCKKVRVSRISFDCETEK